MTVVESDVDLFSPEVVVDPYPVLAELRGLGRVVYMSKYDFWLLTRYADVKEASGDWETYTSRYGVSMQDEFNGFLEDSVLSTDPPEHDKLRAILYDELAPRALAGVKREIEGWASEFASDLTARGAFDACEDLAFRFPITVVSNLVGLPLEGRERFRPGADAMFACFAPVTEYMQERFQELMSYQEWMIAAVDASKLAPGRWGAKVMKAVAEGRISERNAVTTLGAYLTAGMDTTVNAISSLFRIFAARPDVWTAVREDPTLIRPAVDEVLRLESPVTGFFRTTTRPVTMDDTVVPEGARVMVHWGAANRDPRQYKDPDTYDLERRPLDHLAFGYGQHSCPGRALAMLEVTALVEAFLPRVESFALAKPVTPSLNPVVHGLESVPLTVTAAGK